MATFRERFDLKEEVLVRMDKEWMRGRVRLIGRKKLVVAVRRKDERFYTETDIIKHHDVLSMAEFAAALARPRSQRRGR